MASVLGANANNPLPPGLPGSLGFGIVGVDWQCRMMPIKVVDSGGETRESYGVQAIDFAVTNGCKVILFSAALTNAENIALERSVSNAIAKGVIFVCPSGNTGRSISVYPAKFAATIAVGAIGYNPDYPTRADFSNFGSELDVVAPGALISTEYPNGDERGNAHTVSGTSFAAAMVAGVCSLMAAVRPDLTHEQARVLLALGARDLGSPGFDEYYGWGVANAYNSVTLARTQIQEVWRGPGNVWHLTWACPPNAYYKQPYQLEFARSLSEPWQVLTNGTFTYESAKVYYNGAYSHDTNRTYWVGPVPTTPGAGKDAYFRVGIRLKE